jgi:hypothetical protein
MRTILISIFIGISFLIQAKQEKIPGEPSKFSLTVKRHKSPTKLQETDILSIECNLFAQIPRDQSTPL